MSKNKVSIDFFNPIDAFEQFLSTIGHDSSVLLDTCCWMNLFLKKCSSISTREQLILPKVPFYKLLTKFQCQSRNWLTKICCPMISNLCKDSWNKILYYLTCTLYKYFTALQYQIMWKVYNEWVAHYLLTPSFVPKISEQCFQ